MKRLSYLFILIILTLFLAPLHATITDCNTTAVSGSFSLTDNQACTPTNATYAPLYSISSNSTFNCNSFSITGDGLVERLAFSIENATNVTLLNCNVRNFSTAVYVSNSNGVYAQNLYADTLTAWWISSANNTYLYNFTFNTNITNLATTIAIEGDTYNTSISNGSVYNATNALVSYAGNNLIVTDFSVFSSTSGIYSFGNTSLLQRISVTNTEIPLQIGGIGNVVTNFTIVNATAASEFSRVGITSNNSVFTNLGIHNASHLALLVLGTNNTFTVNITNTNGTAVTLLENAANNSLYFLNLFNNTLDLNITDSNGTVYGNSFSGNLTSFFVNVSNANSTIASLYNLALVANTTQVTINLTISNSTGTINLTNLVNYFNLSNNSANLDSTLYSFLSQPAVITFSAVSYTNTSVFEILRDGAVCSDSICTKISSNPVSFRVTGFSNYSTRAVQVNTSSASNSTNSSSTSSNSTSSSSTSSTNSSTASTTSSNSSSGDQTEANSQSSSQSDSQNAAPSSAEAGANTTANSTANSTLGSALADAWLNTVNEPSSAETPTLLSGLFNFATTTAQPWIAIAVLGIIGTIGAVLYNKFYAG